MWMAYKIRGIPGASEGETSTSELHVWASLHPIDVAYQTQGSSTSHIIES